MIILSLLEDILLFAIFLIIIDGVIPVCIQFWKEAKIEVETNRAKLYKDRSLK
jgi:hypothetical protein